MGKHAPAMYEHGVHGMGEHGVPDIGEHGVPGMGEYGVPGMGEMEYLGWISRVPSPSVSRKRDSTVSISFRNVPVWSYNGAPIC